MEGERKKMFGNNAQINLIRMSKKQYEQFSLGVLLVLAETGGSSIPWAV